MTNAELLLTFEGRHFWSIGRDLLFDHLIERLGPTTGQPRILDIGCGTGRYAAGRSERSGSVTAIDVGLPQDLPPGPGYVLGVADRLPFRPDSFDLVLARDVLEHVDDAATLAECRRIMTPGAILIAAVPAWPRLWSHRDERAGHLRRYRRRDIVGVLQQGGFRPIEVRGYQLTLLPLFVASRAISGNSGRRNVQREDQVNDHLNRVLTKINSLEAGLARRSWTRPPTGSSYVIVAVNDA